MTVEIVPFEAGCGAEIRGVDIRKPLAPANCGAVRKAWLDHLVLRFRDAPMSDEQHMAFTGQFGALEFNPAKLIEKQYGVETQSTGRQREIPPEISVISNILENGKPIGGLGDGEAFWHTDSSFVDVPPAASLLRCLECPSPAAGGSTYFLNMYSAYETLSADVKQRVDGLKLRHPATHDSGGKPREEFAGVTDLTRVPGAVHPLVRTHPETGRKCLYLGRRINAYVLGLPVEESERLLDFLWEHTSQERFTWKQEWRVGDLVWWDNRCAMHRRDAFDPAARRLMHRTQLKGTPPV
ncbi:MAG TPA: TauD/TfdA family dioxygenase [Stellaceae bacterium]